jgi:beta-lactamase class A
MSAQWMGRIKGSAIYHGKENPAILRRYGWYTASIFAGILVLVVIAQLLYPPGRLLPFVRINDETMGGKTVSQAVAAMESRFKAATFEVRAGSVTHTQTFEQVGIDVRPTPTAIEAGRYTVRQRLTPFSSFFIMARRNVPMQVRVDKERVHYFAERIERESSAPAVNASIAIKGERVRLVGAKPSQEFLADKTYDALLSAHLRSRIVVTMRPVTNDPPLSDAKVQETLQRAQQIVDTPLVLRIGDADVRVDKATVASWLDFPITDGKMGLAIKHDSVKKYVTEVQPQGYRAPTSTRITFVDGQETGRIVGMNGQGVDVEAATKQIAEHVKAVKKEALTLPTVSLAPGTTYDRQYTGSSAGLFSYLRDLVASKGDYAITVMELSGPRRTASVNGDKVYVAASTYKLFIAYAVFQLTANGEMRWDDTIGDMRADECFEAMIVHSDNACSWAFGERIGWQRIHDYMRSIGLASTTLNGDGDGKYTSANDLALYLQKLEDGTLLPAASRDVLIGYLKRQVYRNGIPAATGLPVANKVGGYGSYVHDAGIIYAPDRTYIMVIMSRGTWPALTTTARQVHSFVMR